MQSLVDILAAVATQRRDEVLQRCAEGADDDLAPEDRPSRALVSPGCLLKFGDDVELFNAEVVRYLCPGRGLGWIYFLCFDADGRLALGQQEAQYVTDRIPADPNETPMPIFAEAPPPEEPA